MSDQESQDGIRSDNTSDQEAWIRLLVVPSDHWLKRGHRGVFTRSEPSSSRCRCFDSVMVI